MIELVVELIFYLGQISLFFRYLFIGAFGLFIWLIILLFSTGNVIFSATNYIISIPTVIWIGVSLYGLSLDIVDYYTYRKYGVKGQDINHYDVDVRSLAGIGPKRVKKLNSIGIFTLADLSVADPKAIINVGIPEKLAMKFIKAAQDRTGLMPGDEITVVE